MQGVGRERGMEGEGEREREREKEMGMGKERKAAEGTVLQYVSVDLVLTASSDAVALVNSQ